jgi:hypothetical protein
MSTPRGKILLVGVLSAILILLALGIADHVRTTLAHVRAKTTAARMVKIMSYLEQDSPESLDPSSFKALLRRHGVEPGPQWQRGLRLEQAIFVESFDRSHAIDDITVAGAACLAAVALERQDPRQTALGGFSGGSLSKLQHGCA